MSDKTCEFSLTRSHAFSIYSVGIFVISHSYSGVVARACGLASLEPTKIAEILKDRTAWFQDC
ncbi:hypothetical protein KY290_036537 [Solanum tuberosum]|uniref:Uncharacterized protein n=1 Tax=Solanum tuberosum TaxID=4113 RepID=A0ABQ7TSZ5_SOLTU|nr:hypothetical protein KY284_037919 [Solanum tuberosum]KAH0636109.1 hypothetical protein KY289_036024 [Solanum tuberosum]KAH0737832.1 hypothetical protein KY290_036537 [Solanum tuberosum]